MYSDALLKTKKIARALKLWQKTDLPLADDFQTKFLVILIALMTFLLVLSMAGMFILGDIINRWSSGLENKMTIEITSETKEGYILSNDAIRKEIRKLEVILKKQRTVKTINVLSEKQIRKLIAPWIGEELNLNDIPLPGLIAVTLNSADQKSVEALEKLINDTSKYARLETHQDWLGNFLSLLKNFKNLSLSVACLVLIITMIGIASAVHARMALYQKDIELLHLIGADDGYIARQFYPHAIVIALKGSISGMIFALLCTFLLTSTSAVSPVAPSITLGLGKIGLLCLTPFLIIALALLMTRITVLRTLLKMP